MKVFRRILVLLPVLFVLYTFYCLLSVWSLCDLKTKNPETTAFIELRKQEWQKDGKQHKIDRRWVPLPAISHHLRNAVIAAEDPNFYKHHGLDYGAIWLGFKTNWKERKIAYGASTITQQLMKNLYLSPSKNPFRKYHEAILALRVERCVPKDRILELYLNNIEWGESTYGVEAAARRYFHKPASALSVGESALLAAMIPNPVDRNPNKKGSIVWKERADVLRWMLKLGMISRAQYDAAR